MDLLAKLPAAEVSIAAAVLVLAVTILRLLDKRNGAAVGRALEARLTDLEEWRSSHHGDTMAGFQRLAAVEADVASLKDEFQRTAERLEQRLEREHTATRQEIKECREEIATGEHRILDELKLLRERRKVPRE